LTGNICFDDLSQDQPKHVASISVCVQRCTSRIDCETRSTSWACYPVFKERTAFLLLPSRLSTFSASTFSNCALQQLYSSFLLTSCSAFFCSSFSASISSDSVEQQLCFLDLLTSLRPRRKPRWRDSGAEGGGFYIQPLSSVKAFSPRHLSVD